MLLIICPLAIFLSLNSNSVWTIFYGQNKFGPSIIKFNILLTILESMYIIVNSLLQSLSKYKVLFISVTIGILINLTFDVPLMMLFNKIGLEAYLGAIFSSFIGLSVSIIIPIIYLNKILNFNYKETIKILPSTIINLVLVILVNQVLSLILPIESASRIIQIMNIGILGIVTVSLYLLLNKNNLQDVLPDKMLKIINKIKLPI